MPGMSVLLFVSEMQCGLHFIPCCVDRSFECVSWTRQRHIPGAPGLWREMGNQTHRKSTSLLLEKLLPKHHKMIRSRPISPVSAYRQTKKGRIHQMDPPLIPNSSFRT